VKPEDAGPFAHNGSGRCNVDGAMQTCDHERYELGTLYQFE